MSWQLDQLKWAFGLGGLMSLYGIVSMVVWLLPNNIFGSAEPYRYKIVVIALVLLTLPIALVGMFIASRRKKKAEAEAAKPQEAQVAEKAADGAPQKLTNPTGNYDELTQSAEETVQFLKNSNVGNGKDAVYALPWYIVAGTPKSGKTSLSLASGLHFQNLPSQRQSEQRFIRPTKNVDWRVTSDAVFLDTAGRYQTEGVDGDEWSAILETVKKYRGARPIDGMILPISTERILHADDADIEQMAKVLRARIDEAIQRTKIRFPIYLVFTHADAIEGFRDSFSTSQKEGENLVWGATIPLEQSKNAHTLFDPEYDLLQNSVMKRRLMRLSAPFPPARQLKIFNFPLHFGSARKKLGHFVSTLFRPNPFSESPFLRGFYFTAVPVNRPQVNGGQTLTNMAQTVGQSYFTNKLYRDVILRDKDLVATLQAQKVKPPIMGWLLTFLGAILVFVLLTLSAVSLYKNKQLVDEASNNGEAVVAMFKANQVANPLDKNPKATTEELEKIDKLRESLETLDNYERNGAPFWMRMGFYSGNKLYLERLLGIYNSAIEQRFKNPTVEKLRQDLTNFSAGKPSAAVPTKDGKPPTKDEIIERNYDLLKAYLMFSSDYKNNVDPNHLTETLKDYWRTESKVPQDMRGLADKQFEFYAKQLDRERMPSVELDRDLVKTARQKVKELPAYLRYYKRVTTEISRDTEGVTVASILANRGDGFIEGATAIQGAYTIDGYRKMQKALDNAQTELAKDDWVMGEDADKTQVQSADLNLLREKYLNDYADNWQKFVRGISIPAYKDKEAQDAKASFKELSKTDSPMKTLLNEIARQTNLSAKSTSGGWIDLLWSFLPSNQPVNTGNKTVVESQFEPLFKFTETNKEGNSPISIYINEISEFSTKKLDPVQASQIPEIIEQSSDPDPKKGFPRDLRNLKISINGKVNEFDKTAAGKDIANVLRKPVTNLEEFFGAGRQQQMANRWKNEILPKAKEAEKGFPYDADGDADLTKLSNYLKPKTGTLSKFYDEQLKQYFEEVNGQLKVKEGSDAPTFTPEFITYLNNAFRLRQALFGDGDAPQFAYEFGLQKVDGTVIEISIDGQKTDSNGTGSVAWKFPAQSGETGVIMKSASTDEVVAPTTPTPTASPATSATPTESSTSSGERQFPGSWGLFKFVEAGSPKKQPTGQYLLTYKIGTKTVNATIKPTGGDLFDRSMFTSARAPEKLN